MTTKTLLRLYITEADKVGHKPLYRELVAFFHKEKIAGCTILKGVAGFGATGRPHEEAILRLSGDLPLVVEVVDEREKIDALILKLKEMAPGKLITLEKVSTK